MEHAPFLKLVSEERVIRGRFVDVGPVSICLCGMRFQDDVLLKAHISRPEAFQLLRYQYDEEDGVSEDIAPALTLIDDIQSIPFRRLGLPAPLDGLHDSRIET